MPSKLRNLILKEVKELARDPKILLGMILVPLVMFPLMGWMIRISISTAQESLEEINVVVMNLDQGEIAKNLIENLTAPPSLNVFETQNPSFDEAVIYMQQVNASDIIIVPRNFTAQVKAGGRDPPVLETYTIFSGKGIAEGASSTIIASKLEQFKRKLAPDPFSTWQGSIVNGEPKPYDIRTLSALSMSQYVTFPVTIMVLLIFAMQLAATSVALEKEEKTLETLLSLPIDRFSILAGKLSGSILVAAIGAVTYLIGFNYYMGSFTFAETTAAPDLASLGLAPSPLAYILMGVSLFVALVSALALAVIVSAFAEDVRGAQAIIGYIYPLLLVPMLLLMFADFNSLPLALRIVLWIIPYSHPVLAARAAVAGDYVTVIGGIVYVLGFTLAILYIAAKLFTTEKILTAKIRMRRFGFGRKSQTKS